MAESTLIGKTVLGYKVTELLGSGAFGTVYKVVKSNPSGDYVRALKRVTIPSGKQQYDSVFNSMGGDLSKVDDYFSAMLKSIVSEIQILNELSEKGVTNIVRYYENDIETSDSPRKYDIYILMEYLTPLSEHLSTNSLTVKNVVNLGLDILTALDLCHANGIVHRDIKDDNIFVSPSGEYKIGDFGVSKVLKDSSRAESVKGTPNFIAPEVYLGKEGYTKTVDLYSLGIVLYRLLNYTRNPFLPTYPASFDFKDEDKAFEERMKGSIPVHPILGGEAIGSVIVKAISASSDRFDTAMDFRVALEQSLASTSQDALSVKINFTNAAVAFTNKGKTVSDESKPVYKETIRETAPAKKLNETIGETESSALHKGLFDTMGEKPNTPVPDAYDSPTLPSHKTPAPKDDSSIISVPTITESEQVKAIDSKVVSKLVYFIPVGIAIIGLIAYFVVIPNIYGKVVSFIDWLFTDPQNIIDTLKDPGAVLPQIHGIIGIRIFWWGWLASFITSLFFVGRQLQRKPKPNAPNALIYKKDAYFIVQEVSSELKLVKQRRSGKELDSLIFAVKKLEEKLSVESDFGYGGTIVIECETNIAKQLQFLRDMLPYIESGSMTENIGKMNSAVANINNLLIRRRELKKR